MATIAGGISGEVLLGGLALVSDIGWSTLPAEQGHGSASSIQKLHQGYGAETLVTRGLVHMMRPLVQPDPVAARTALLQ